MGDPRSRSARVHALRSHPAPRSKAPMLFVLGLFLAVGGAAGGMAYFRNRVDEDLIREYLGADTPELRGYLFEKMNEATRAELQKHLR